MTIQEHIDAAETDTDLRRSLASDPEKLAAALEIVARARRLNPDAVSSGAEDTEEKAA